MSIKGKYAVQDEMADLRRRRLGERCSLESGRTVLALASNRIDESYCWISFWLLVGFLQVKGATSLDLLLVQITCNVLYAVKRFLLDTGNNV